MFIKKTHLLLTLFIISLVGCSGLNNPAANIKLPAIFSDNMVLQQGMPIPFWGTANPGGKVEVKIGDVSASSIVLPDSNWRVNVPAIEAYGGPHTVQVIGQDTTTFENVMIGEVWVCSGQSNMEMPLAGWGMINNYEQEIAKADHPNIRLLTIPRAMKAHPVNETETEGWVMCNPDNIPGFSATAYFFGRKLNQDLNVPVGLIHSSWGGTPAEAWTSRKALQKMEDYKYLAEPDTLGDDPSFEEQMQQYEQQMVEWEAKLDAIVKKAQGDGPDWSSPEVDTKTWDFMNVPVLWEKAGLENYNGIVWFHKTFTLSASDADQDAVLSLGPIDDIDDTYVNGVKIGSTNQYHIKRVYKVPASSLKAGENLVAVQVLDTGGGGGFWGTPGEMKLVTGSGKTIRMDGVWKYKTGVSIHDIPMQPISPASPYRPSVLYNGMIYPLVPYAIRGAIWYQGEANASRAKQYRELFKTMITDWRTAWGQGDFPFILTQLASYTDYKSKPGEDEWAELREAQTMALELPNTAMAVTIDIGDADDIHPKNKQDVGKRLALNALNMVYGKEDVVPCGPLYKSYSIDGNKVVISFDYVDGGLEAKDGDLVGFAIAGSDSNWVWADAKIVGETVEVWSDSVAEPVAVRYAWQSNPRCNLFNAAGLPASPFRTDDWPGITN